MQTNKIKNILKLLVLVKPLSFKMIIAISMGVLGYLCATFLTILGAYALMNIIGINDINLNYLIGLIILVAIARGILHYIEQYHNHYIAFKLLAIIRDKVFKALRRLTPAKLDGKDAGNLVSIITSDIELLEVFYAHTISPIFIATITTSIMVIFISNINLYLGLIILIAHLIVGVIIPIIASKKSNNSGKGYRAKLGDLNTYFLDSIFGNQEIVQYNNIEDRKAIIERKSLALEQENRMIKMNANTFSSMTTLIIMLSGIAMLFVSTNLYLNGLINVNDVVISTVSIFSSFGAVFALSNLGVGLTQTFASATRVLNILEEEPLIEDVENKSDIEFNEANFSNVNFSYQDELILDDITLDIKKNKIIGLHGKSGSGKSTMLKLLMRFYDVQKGEVKINDLNIKEINTKSLRDNQSLVIQSTHLFHDTIKNNIKLAKLDASDEEIIEACKKASIHDFIMTLEHGYDTMISEHGENLSGGQKQRIGIARSFLHEANLIMLDEPTSNLDSLNELVILKSLKEIKDKTIILVSHRKSTMSICDEIFNVKSNRSS